MTEISKIVFLLFVSVIQSDHRKFPPNKNKTKNNQGNFWGSEMPLKTVFSRHQNWSRHKPYSQNTITAAKELSNQLFGLGIRQRYVGISYCFGCAAEGWNTPQNRLPLQDHDSESLRNLWLLGQSPKSARRTSRTSRPSLGQKVLALSAFVSQAKSQFKRRSGDLEVPDILLPDVGNQPTFSEKG